MSRRHWGPEAPPGGEGSGSCLGAQRGTGAAHRWGSMGRSRRKQNGFEVFVLALLRAMLTILSILNEHHQLVFFIPHFIILLHAIS